MTKRAAPATAKPARSTKRKPLARRKQAAKSRPEAPQSKRQTNVRPVKIKPPQRVPTVIRLIEWVRANATRDNAASPRAIRIGLGGVNLDLILTILGNHPNPAIDDLINEGLIARNDPTKTHLFPAKWIKRARDPATLPVISENELAIYTKADDKPTIDEVTPDQGINLDTATITVGVKTIESALFRSRCGFQHIGNTVENVKATAVNLARHAYSGVVATQAVADMKQDFEARLAQVQQAHSAQFAKIEKRLDAMAGRAP